MEKQIKLKILGMDTDSDVSIVKGDSSLENHNVRFTVTEEGAANAAISNEKGTKLISEIDIGMSTPIGYCTIFDYIIIFTTNSGIDKYNDNIYIYKYSNGSFAKYYQYKGDFNFNEKCPIECQTVWEREDLLKVFWIDGENPLRFLTIFTNRTIDTNTKEVESNYFDVVKEIDFSIDLENSISVSKQTFGGTFKAGIIQYAFTYYTKYGAESNIFKITPLFYVSNSETGTPSDRSVDCSFKIAISKVDKSNKWDYLRIYSISRTSIDGTPVCKRVADIKIDNFINSTEGTEGTTITYIDNGELGETIDSTRLLYVGGERIIPKTIAQKDGTLFLGNYKIIRPEIDKEVKNKIKETLKANKDSFFNIYYTENNKKYARKIVSVLETKEAFNSTYQYTPQLLSSQNKISTFKSNETYRIGIQLQDKTGRWSEPIFLFDSPNNVTPNTTSSIIEKPDLSLESTGNNTDGNTILLQKPKPSFDRIQDVGIDESGGGGGSTNSSSNSTTSTKAINSAVQALLPFGYLNIKLGEISYNNSNVLNYIKLLGYVRIRPIIVYPNEGNREVLFQGVANPTIKKRPNSLTGADFDYRIPSWFFRPIESNNSSTGYEGHYGYKNEYKIGESFKGVYPVYKDGEKIPYYSYDKLYKNSQAEFQYKINDDFIIDWSTLTIDSPDIRFNEQLSLSDLEDVKARVVGLVDIAGNAASYSIEIDGSTEVPEALTSNSNVNNIPFGNKTKVQFRYLSGNISSLNYGACLINYPLWIDAFSDNGQKGYDRYFAQWYVYPWHRNGSLNNCSSTNMNNVEGAARPSMLKRKIFSNSRFCYNTIYGASTDVTVEHARVFIQTSDNQVDRFSDGTIFKNTVDIVIPASGLPSYRALGEVIEKTNSLYDIEFNYYCGTDYTEKTYTLSTESGDKSHPTDTGWFAYKFFREGTEGQLMQYYDPHHDTKGNDNSYHIGTDPIPMQFKTGSNCVIKLNKPLGYNDLTFNDGKLFKETAYGHWLPIVEIYREVKNKFGGDSDDALQQNAWLVAGKPVNISEDIKLFWEYGDTYFQRYDCLKTIPYSETSVNNIIEILSFFCETRINIDGRYDVNRGLQDNTIITTNNFNQLNDVYTQSDNYFQYYTSDEDLTKLSSYQNQIIWSLTRKSGDLVDSWTNVTLLNSLDLDGSKGQVRAIKNFNGQLYVFQDSGISSINYNQNVVLNSENGVPIEIGNSGKVSGSTYLSTSQGCINKWAIVDVGQGLIFLDQLNKQFNIFDGKQIVDLGEQSKFQSWIKKNCGSTDQWNPTWKEIDPNTITFLYDNEVNEILLTNKKFSVAYNLGLMKFTSFYSYEGSPWMTRFNSKQLIFNKDTSKLWKVWNVRQGEYNKFFGKFSPYSIEFVASDINYFDYMKLFSTIEIRDNIVASKEDTYERDPKKYNLQDSFSFDHIRVRNSYQDSGEEDIKLEFKRNKPSNLKAKFRTWRINVPRNASKMAGRIRDRMKDHYMIVKLSHLNEVYNLSKVHDIIVSYII